MAKLTSNGQDVGPASYDAAKARKAVDKRSPNPKLDGSSQERSILARTATEYAVGPGSYENANGIDRSIKRPTIPRAGGLWRTVNVPKKRIKNRGSIRADYEEGDTTSEEGADPGPGGYLKNHHVSDFG